MARETSHYRVEVDKQGCEACGDGTFYDIVSGYDDEAVGSSQHFSDRELAEWICEQMNNAYLAGRAAGIENVVSSPHSLMNLSSAQFMWLRWLVDNGGAGRVHGPSVKAITGEHANASSAVAFLNLVAKGAIVVHEGNLTVSDYGRRLLKP